MQGQLSVGLCLLEAVEHAKQEPDVAHVLHVKLQAKHN